MRFSGFADWLKMNEGKYSMVVADPTSNTRVRNLESAYTPEEIMAYISDLTKEYGLTWEYIQTKPSPGVIATVFTNQHLSKELSLYQLRKILSDKGIRSVVHTQSDSALLTEFVIIEEVQKTDEIDEFLKSHRGEMAGKKYGI